MQIRTCPVVVLSIAAVLLAATGCESTPNPARPIFTASDTAEPPGTEPPPATQPATPPEAPEDDAIAQAEADEKERQEEEEKQAEEDAKDARQLAKQERDLVIAHHNLEKAKTEQTHAAAQHEFAVARAAKDLELQKQRHKDFLERHLPVRIARAELGVVRMEDRVKEAVEELKQLETMYAQEDFADHTKEIVLDRGRRRLERDRADLELRRKDLVTLIDHTIPREKAEQVMGVEQKTNALEKAQRGATKSQMDRKIAVMRTEADIAGKEADIAAFREKIEKKKQKRREEAESQASGQE